MFIKATIAQIIFLISLTWGHPNRPNAIRPKAIGPKEKMPRASETMLLGEVNASKHCWR